MPPTTASQANQYRRAVTQIPRWQIVDGTDMPAQHGRNLRGREMEHGSQPEAEPPLIGVRGWGTLQKSREFDGSSWWHRLWLAHDRLLAFTLAFLIV
jgi:hypothetical protein